MNREEFLSRLASALNGEVHPSVIQENLKYYDEYIREEAAKGRSEEEVIDEIGGYRLIAKTIIEANGGGDSQGAYGGQTYDQEGFYSSRGDSGDYQNYDKSDPVGGSFRMYDFSRGWRRFIIPAVLVLAIVVVFSIIGGIFSLLRPIIGPLLVVWFLYSIFKRKQ